MYIIVSLGAKSTFISDVKTFSETEDIHEAAKFSDEEDSMKLEYILNKVREVKKMQSWCMPKVNNCIFGTEYEKPTDLGFITLSEMLGGKSDG
jgi:hypothetical protein